MTIPATARPTVPSIPNARIAFIDLQTGNLTSNGLGTLTDLLNYVIGGSRIIPCEATGTNAIVLTMLSISPLISRYNDYDVFSFVAAATSTGLITANVTTPQGALAPLSVYKSNGLTNAGAGDIVSGCQYTLTYVDSFIGGGGFALR